jgi:hypothetical protein
VTILAKILIQLWSKTEFKNVTKQLKLLKIIAIEETHYYVQEVTI